MFAVLAAAIPKGTAPLASALLRSTARLAISVPIALVLGVPVAFLGLVLGTMGVLGALGGLLLVLCVWSCMPLLRLFGPALERHLQGKEANPSIKQVAEK